VQRIGQSVNVTDAWTPRCVSYDRTVRVCQTTDDARTISRSHTYDASRNNQHRFAATSTAYRFTGKERDQESGNDYFGARYYASTMGRFLSPDWSARMEPVPYAKLDNPQSLNLYAYVGNNPLSRTDPDGHCDSSATASARTKCQNVQNLHLSDAMKQNLKMTEGLSEDKKHGVHKGDPALTVYPDKAGNPTVGWGHEIKKGDNLKLGDTIDEKRAQTLFDQDTKSFEDSTRNILTKNGDHQFSQGEFDALTDLGNLCTSPKSTAELSRVVSG
jgi:RHS repeat-associated protein